MSLFISDAHAQGGAAAQGGDPLGGLLFFVVIFVLFYFLMVRPQVKRSKEHKKMVEALDKGDEVITNGGMVGKITRLEDGFVSLEIASGVVVQVQRSAVLSLLPKGTIKAA